MDEQIRHATIDELRQTREGFQELIDAHKDVPDQTEVQKQSLLIGGYCVAVLDSSIDEIAILYQALNESLTKYTEELAELAKSVGYEDD